MDIMAKRKREKVATLIVRESAVAHLTQTQGTAMNSIAKEPTTCPVCHGTGIEELAYGLVQRKCGNCGGTGKI